MDVDQLEANRIACQSIQESCDNYSLHGGYVPPDLEKFLLIIEKVEYFNDLSPSDLESSNIMDTILDVYLWMVINCLDFKGLTDHAFDNATANANLVEI